MTAFERAAALFARLAALDATARDVELARESDDEVRALAREMLDGDAAPHAGLATGLPGVGALIGDALRDGSPDASVDDDAARFELAGGPYRVLGVLARGGMGVVLRAHDERIGRDVAVKVLPRTSRDAADARLRFTEEAQVAGQLEHPGVVPIYQLGEDDRGRPFFAMKLVEGETLAARLSARTDPSEDRARFLALFLRVCQTVAYAHARHVIHRDLKPANVMIGAFGEVQVLDWGLAKVLGGAERITPRERAALETVRSGSDSESASVSGTVMGTPRYMPPEQANGDVERLDRRSDVFSLGAILCEVLTGSPPFTGTRADALRDARDGRLDAALERLARCDADPAIVALATRSIAADPDARPADAGELADQVERSLEAVERRAHDAEVAARSALARAAADRRAGRMKIVAIAGAAVFVVVLAGVFLWRAFERERDTLRLSNEVDAALDVADARFATARASAPDDADARGSAWDAAALAIASAESLLAGGETTDAVRDRSRALRDAFDPAHAAALDAAARLARDRAMLARLDDVRTPTGDGRDPYHYPSMNDAYRAAFEEYGVDVGDAEAASAALRASAIAPALAAALDQWALCNQVLSDATSQQRADVTHHLLLLAEDADPHAVRGRIRRALRENDLAALVEISAGEPELEPESFVLLAGGLRINGDDDRAVRVLRLATTRYPGDYWLSMHAALAERSVAPDMASTRAIAAFRAALAARPASTAARHLMGQTLVSCGRLEDARAVFAELVARDGAKGHWRAHLGSCVMQLDGPRAARDVLAEAVRLAPDDSYALDWYGGCNLRLGASWTAADALHRAAAIDPTPDALLRWAAVANEVGDNAASLAAFRRVLAVRPDDWDAMYGAALQARDLGMYDLAQQWMRRCTQQRPDNPEAWCNLGWTYFDDGEVAAAVPCFERGDALGRASADWRYPSADWLALAQRTLRDVERLQDVVDDGFDPAGPRALEVAEAARLAGRPRVAADWYERVARTGRPLSSLDVALSAEASCAAAAVEAADAARSAHLADALQRLEALREMLMRSFREDPAREWRAVRGFLLSVRHGVTFRALRPAGVVAATDGEVVDGDAANGAAIPPELPDPLVDRARALWRTVDADVAAIDAYARENH